MSDSISQVLVRTTVRKALKDIKESPERATRNIVDLALNFARGRFQQKFFADAQQMLTNEHSAYYELIEDTVRNVDEDRLLTVGMNVGYNGCTAGARQIRSIEAEEGFQVPWELSLGVNGESLSANRDSYHTLIRQGEAMGIHTWMLFTEKCVPLCLSLAQEHPNCAFGIFCRSEEIDGALIGEAAKYNNVMIFVSFDGYALDACTQLRQAGLLYGLFYCYGEEDLDRIESGNLFRAMARHNAVFSVLVRHPGCPREVQEQVYEKVVSARLAQTYRSVMWELHGDGLMVDGIISEDTCWVAFDNRGDLRADDSGAAQPQYNIFRSDLRSILKQAFPKAGKEHR